MSPGQGASRRIRFWTVGDATTASTRYRVLAHLPALEAAGFSAEVRYPRSLGSSKAFRYVWRAVDLLRDVSEAGGAGEILFVQRKMYPGVFASRLSRPGRSLVFDMDDALDIPPPGLDLGPRAVERYRRNFEATTNAANLVLIGSRGLASRLPHQRVELLPTPIDTARFSPRRVGSSRGPAVGWVGHSGNLPYLESLADPLRELARRHDGFRLIVVADREPSIPGVEVEFRRWSLERELECFDGIGIGLMPLDDTPWARGKCAFKAIQYMSLGIPTVASPVGANRDLITAGENGFLAGSAAEWVEALDALITSADLARRLGDAGRQTVLEGYSLEVVSRRLVGLLRAVAS